MTAVWVDSDHDDDTRRAGLYSGDLYLANASPAGEALCAFARELAEEAFDGLDPRLAQHEMAVEAYAAVLAELKPRFIHHQRSKELLRDLLAEQGCDLDQVHVDVPRLRSSTSDGYLTTGIAYAWHPHRDTWYSAPMTQLNWWLPVYPVRPDNAMAFHLEHFDRVVENDSEIYNYYVWNSTFRAAAASQVGKETRPLPRPRGEIDRSTAVVPLPPVGGYTLFSGQQLHSSVPNTSGVTRFSIDFRTVHIGDVAAGRSAPNVDAACTGSSIRDFVRARDFAPMPQQVVSLFDDGTESQGELRYESPEAQQRR